MINKTFPRDIRFIYFCLILNEIYYFVYLNFKKAVRFKRRSVYFWLHVNYIHQCLYMLDMFVTSFMMKSRNNKETNVNNKKKGRNCNKQSTYLTLSRSTVNCLHHCCLKMHCTKLHNSTANINKARTLIKYVKVSTFLTKVWD